MKRLVKNSRKKINIRMASFLPCCLFMLVLLIVISLVMTVTGQEEMKKSIQIINPRPNFSLFLRLDKGVGATYAPGEMVRISFSASKDTYVTLFRYDVLGNVQLLFPNQNQKNPLVKANRNYYVDFMIEQGTLPGIEYIQGFASTEPVLLTREMERRLEVEFLPKLSTEVHSFIQNIRGILTGLPAQQWVSSEVLHYQILERRPGTGQLWVNSHPEGASVYLNGRYVGQTPLELAQINVGEYLVQVELTGYESWQRVVQINDSRTTFLSADLKSTGQYGTIVIRCDVDLARIYLDGQFKRLTHKNRDIVLDDIPAGFHDLSIALSGYHDWSQRIEVKPNQKVQLTIYLDKIVGTGGLEIAGNVDNALIYLDEVYYGETSSSGRITISDIPEGSYELRMVKEGYDDYLTTVRIYPDRISKIDVIMQQEYQEYQKPEEGAVALYCNEDGARIFLDGFYITTTSASQAQVIEELKEGVYEITVIKEGYRIWQEEIYVSPGETVSVFADLVKIEK